MLNDNMVRDAFGGMCVHETRASHHFQLLFYSQASTGSRRFSLE